MDTNVMQMWSGMSAPVRWVVLVLSAQALACIYVAIDRVLLLYAAYRQGRRFARSAAPVLARGDYGGALRIAREHPESHLASLIVTGVETFADQRRRGADEGTAAYLTDRALARESEQLSAALNRGMNILASTGSTAPFIGLLGTVLGVLTAFKLLAEQGSENLRTLGAALSDALVVTGYGLIVAIPSVLLFNWLSARLSTYEQGLNRARAELVDRLEGGHGADWDEPEFGDDLAAEHVVPSGA